MDIDIYLRFLVALAVVLGLIGAIAWLARRFGVGGTAAVGKGHLARLALVEMKVLDSRRKLLLVRRDGCEHLVLLGPNRDFLVESVPPGGGGGPTPAETATVEAESINPVTHPGGP